ncbi:MAG: cyclic nucleotide-binding domain-containing protein [Deltaproteobacteria bacterium]|nr:cyclic nucleotide-binding domain-containing protein [Deltaproteobacteria bacterium]
MTRSGLDTIREWLWAGERVRAGYTLARLLQEEPGDLHAFALCGTALLELGRRAEGLAALRTCAEAATETGNLPLALSCLFSLSDAEEAVDELFHVVIAEYHRDAPRVDPKLRLAPPLPRPLPDVAPAVDEAEAIRLALAAAKAAADRWAFERSTAIERPPLPMIPFLGNLSADSMAMVLANAEAVEFGPGKLLVEQGAEGDALFLILCGWAKVVRRARTGEEQVLRRLAPGSVVGEVALVTRAPRVASVVSETGVQALRLRREVVEELAQREPALAEELVEFCRQKMLANLLETSPVLRPLAEAERAELVRGFDRRVEPRGAVPIRQGEPSPGLFLIVVGQAEVLKREGPDDPVIRLAVLGPGDVFGEMSLVLEGPATATIQMVYDSALLVLPRDRFLRTVQAHPELREELARVAREREEETRSLLGQASVAADDITLV